MKNKVHIHPAFILMWVLFIILDKGSFMLYIFMAAALHEVAHLYMYLIFKAQVDRLDILPFGLSLKLTDASALKPWQEALCACGGIIMNVTLAAAVYFIYGCNFFFWCNISLACINALPITPLDGGRALYFAMLCRFSQPAAEKISIIISLLCLLPFTFAAFWLLFKTGFNISLLLIDVYLIFYLIVKRHPA